MSWSLSWSAQALLRLRNRHFLLLDVLVLCVTPAIALMLRVDGVEALSSYAPALLLYTGAALIITLAVFIAFGLYSRYWRYASIDEMMQIVAASLVATLLVVGVFFAVRIPALGICGAVESACSLPRSVPFIDAMLVVLAVGATRVSVRTADLYLQQGRAGQATQRVLIMGAGEAGAMIAREMRANPQLGLDPIGFLDDDDYKRRMRIRGLPVLGNRSDLPNLVEDHRVDQVIIAMPTAPGKAIRDVLAICDQAGVPAKTMPGMYELLGGQVGVSQLRTVQIEDLLRRDPVQTNVDAVQAMIRGKRVLVTGGGGSIGSELCRQVLRYHPAQLLVLGHGENSIFEITQELARSHDFTKSHQVPKTELPTPHSPLPTHHSSLIVPLIADVRSADRINTVFEQYRPQIVFHAAAHKHVPLMEDNVAEAITNNVVGTRNVVQAAQAVGVECFVLISTDKAVNPTSIMGASKRTAELLVHQAARQNGQRYLAVRFGNVLGSRGSVVLTFKKQIAAGGPITVTHPAITRFFMTIPEAVQLTLQAAVLGQGGEVMVLDMGDPVKIVDLAQDLVHLSGLEVGEDIDIVFTGLRPGEKLYEELFIPGETYGRTAHEKIFVAIGNHPGGSNGANSLPDQLDDAIQALASSAQRNDRDAIVRGLRGLIPEFEPSRTSVVPLETAQSPEAQPVESGRPALAAAGAS